MKAPAALMVLTSGCFAGTSGIALYVAAVTHALPVSLVLAWAVTTVTFWSECGWPSEPKR